MGDSNWNRRRFLRGAGGIVVALPFLEMYAPRRAAAQATPPKRLVMIGHPMGIANEEWKPTGANGSLTLPGITAPLDPIKNKCVFLSESERNIVTWHSQSMKYGHPGKKSTTFTNTVPAGAFTAGTTSNHVDNVNHSVSDENYGGAGGESIETMIGRYLRGSQHSRDAVNLSVYSHHRQRGYHGGAGGFFWEGRNAAVTCEYNPAKAFNDLFSGLTGTGGPPPALTERQMRQESVLDAVRESFGLLRRGLGTDDQQRLDAHAQRIREIEREITYSATCSAPVFSGSESVVTTPQNAGEDDEDYMNRLFGQQTPDGIVSAPMNVVASLHAKIMAHAMACDIAPVGRIAFSQGQVPFFGIPAVDDEISNYDGQSWHALVHDAGTNMNNRTGMPSRPRRGGPGYYAPELIQGMRLFYQTFADLAIELDRIPDGTSGETALDNTLIVIGSDLGEGSGHGPGRTGYVFGGNTGGTGGRHIDVGAAGQGDSQIINSIARIFDARDSSGAPVTHFGLQGWSAGEGTVAQIFT